MISVCDICAMKSAFDIILLQKLSVKYVALMMIKLRENALKLHPLT